MRACCLKLPSFPYSSSSSTSDVVICILLRPVPSLSIFSSWLSRLSKASFKLIRPRSNHSNSLPLLSICQPPTFVIISSTVMSWESSDSPTTPNQRLDRIWLVKTGGSDSSSGSAKSRRKQQVVVFIRSEDNILLKDSTEVHQGISGTRLSSRLTLHCSRLPPSR